MKAKLFIVAQITLLLIVCGIFLYENGYEKHHGSNAIKHYGHTDLTVFWVAGETLLPSTAHKPEYIYKQGKFKPMIEAVHPVGTGKHFLYPPTSAMAFAPLAIIELDTLGKWWATANAILFIMVYLGTIILVLRDTQWYRLRYSAVLLTVTFSYPLISQFSTGQVNIILWALFMVFIWLLAFQRKGLQIAAGITLSVAALVKIFPAMFILPLAVGKRWWALFSGSLTGIVIVSLSLFWFSLADWWHFISVRFPKIAAGEIATKYASFSIYGSMRQLLYEGTSEKLGFEREQYIAVVEYTQTILTIGIGITLILFTLYVAKRVTKKTSLHYAMMTYSFFMISFILFSKIILIHYFILLIPVVLFLLIGKTVRKNYVFIGLIGIAVYLMFYGNLSIIYLGLNKPATWGAGILFVLTLLTLNEVRITLPKSVTVRPWK